MSFLTTMQATGTFGLRGVDSGTYRVSAPSRMRVVHSAGEMNVYRRKAQGMKPYVVGTERNGRLVLLEEFDDRVTANAWADMNKEG